MAVAHWNIDIRYLDCSQVRYPCRQWVPDNVEMDALHSNVSAVENLAVDLAEQQVAVAAVALLDDPSRIASRSNSAAVLVAPAVAEAVAVLRFPLFRYPFYGHFSTHRFLLHLP